MMLLFCTVVGLFLVASYLVLYFLVARTIHKEFDARELEAATLLSKDLATYTASPNDITEVGLPGEIFEIFDEHGETIALSPSLRGRSLGLWLEHASDLPTTPVTFDLPEQGKVRALSVPVRAAPITTLDTLGIMSETDPSGGTLTVCNLNIVRTSTAATSSTGRGGMPDLESTPPSAGPKLGNRGSTCLTIPADDSWRYAALPMPETGAWIASFDATPSLPMNASIGLSDGQQTRFPAYPLIVKLFASGLIQARNDKSDQGAVAYRGGHTYHFRLSIDIPLHRYSVFVSQLGQAEHTVGSNLSLRSGRNWTLVVARSTSETDKSLTQLRRVILILLVSNLLAVALVSTAYVRRGLRPLSDLTARITAFAQYIRDHPSSEARLHERVGPALAVLNTQDEPGQLADAFNQFVATLDCVLRQLQQFVSDASHELRTPLSVLQGEAELLLRKPRSADEYRQAVGTILTEVKHLSEIVERLFTLAMSDAGQFRIAEETLYLNQVLEEACALAHHRTLVTSITIEREPFDEPLVVGDEALLRELFLIVLDNAMRYSPAHSSIQVRLKEVGGTAVVELEDHGVGIAPEHLPHIFERFYRVPASGNGDTQSGGLGLAIAKAIVKAHGGDIQCASAVGRGSVFTIKLPCAIPGKDAPEMVRPESSVQGR